MHETTGTAIGREKQLQKWKRALIDTANPFWEDLYDGLS